MDKEDVNIKVEISGIEFKNPIMAAAGPPVRNGEKILECVEGGAGGIVTKTISSKAPSLPNPAWRRFLAASSTPSFGQS